MRYVGLSPQIFLIRGRDSVTITEELNTAT
jgi:hypothetical protein